VRASLAAAETEGAVPVPAALGQPHTDRDRAFDSLVDGPAGTGVGQGDGLASSLGLRLLGPGGGAARGDSGGRTSSLADAAGDSRSRVPRGAAAAAAAAARRTLASARGAGSIDTGAARGGGQSSQGTTGGDVGAGGGGSGAPGGGGWGNADHSGAGGYRWWL
jgi:hypothetical protein